MTGHIDPLRAIKQRLAEVTQPIGLELREMDVRVAENGANDMVVALFTIDLEQIGKSEEQIEVDAQFQELERSFREQQQEEKFAAARASLEKLGLIYKRKEDE